MTQITIGTGITIGGGITFGATGLIITSADFANSGGAPGVSPNGTNGFTTATSGNFNNLVNYVYYMYNPQGDVATRLASAFSAAGMDTAYAYAWNATWSAESTQINTIVRMSWSGSNLDMCVIDTSDTQWQSGAVSGPTLLGTFNFPATFRPYSPLTQLSSAANWC